MGECDRGGRLGLRSQTHTHTVMAELVIAQSLQDTRLISLPFHFTYDLKLCLCDIYKTTRHGCKTGCSNRFNLSARVEANKDKM